MKLLILNSATIAAALAASVLGTSSASATLKAGASPAASVASSSSASATLSASASPSASVVSGSVVSGTLSASDDLAASVASSSSASAALSAGASPSASIASSSSGSATLSAGASPSASVVSGSVAGGTLSAQDDLAALATSSSSATGVLTATAGLSASVASGSSASASLEAISCFEEDLLAYLAALGMTVYPGHIPQGVNPPAITFVCVSEEPSYTLKAAAGLTAKSYQFSAWSNDFLETVAMERSLRSALHGYRGLMGATWVSSCRLQNMLDLPPETNVDGSDESTYHRASEYRIWLKESIPVF